MTTENAIEKKKDENTGISPGIRGDGQQSISLDPDLEFIKEMSAVGGDAFKKCYQCATCSATCPISPDDNPFPRKEMIWSAWGLKDRLLKDPDVWLCHQCNDCSAICPREANPGDILALVRQSSYKHYAVPSIMGKMLHEPRYLPFVLGIPILIVFAAFLGFGHLGEAGDEIIFKNFMPHPVPLDLLFGGIATLAAVFAAMGGLKFWNALKEGPRPPVDGAPGFIPGLIAAVKEIASHKQFNECDKANPRYYSHLLTFYGFIALFLTTSAVFLGLYLHYIFPFIGHLETPLNLLHPIKLLGNLGAIAFLVGTGTMLYDRITDKERFGISTYNDWLFIGIMFGLAVSGILAQVFRLADIASLAYLTYFIHLVLVLSMMAYFPYSKFAHLLYRTLAITYYYGYGSTALNEKSSVETADVVSSEKEPEAA